MNQILDYSPNKSTGGGSSKSDKIVRVFAVLLAVFAICLFGVAGYSILNNKGEEDTLNTSDSTKKLPVIDAQVFGANIKITVTHDKALDKIAYRWESDDKENIIPCNGQTEFTTEISLVAGDHYLTIQATDEEGTVGSFEKAFTSEFGEDKKEPTIEDQIIGDKIYFTVTDETEMGFVTYRWNDEDEIRVEPNEENPKVIEFDVEIPKGENALLVYAVDKNNNPKQFSQKYTGITKPNITLTVSPEKDKVTVEIFHDVGIEEILLEVNGVSQNVVLPEDNPNPQNVMFDFKISGARNVVKVAAKSVDGTTNEDEKEIINDRLITDNIEISIEQSEENKNMGNVTIYSPDGIKELNLIINDNDYSVTLDDEIPEAERTNISLQLSSLVDGVNKIIFKIVKPDGTLKEVTKEIYCQ